uniref:Ig-like domain-containing protein n=1 Tax=Anabas testudineus TaxID=64144 RepID=A0AAQ6IS06_ANATE
MKEETSGQRHKRLSVFHVRQPEFVGSCQHMKLILINTLNVTFSSDAPKDTSASISPSGLVSAGSWVNLTCSSRAKPPVSSFTWFKISTDGDKTVSEGDFYRLNVTDGGVYYCVATNELGNQRSPEIHVNIEGKY